MRRVLYVLHRTSEMWDARPGTLGRSRDPKSTTYLKGETQISRPRILKVERGTRDSYYT